MNQDLLDLYDRASAWTNSKVEGATEKLDATTPCDEWDVRTLLNHMLETQRYFLGSAQGQDVSPPSTSPPELLSEQPADDFARARREMLDVYGEPGVIEKTGPSLGIAFSDLLLHGWDLAKATGQDTTLDPELVDACWTVINPQMELLRGSGMFGNQLDVPDTADDQTKLLAVLGRRA